LLFLNRRIFINKCVSINNTPNATMFDFFEYKTNEGEISLKLRNKKELRFVHIFDDNLNKLTYFFKFLCSLYPKSPITTIGPSNALNTNSFNFKEK